MDICCTRPILAICPRAADVECVNGKDGEAGEEVEPFSFDMYTVYVEMPRGIILKGAGTSSV